MKKIIALLTVFVFAVLVTGCGKETKKEKESKPVVNTNINVVKDQEVEVFSFTKTSLVYKDGISTLVTSVKNNSKKTEYIKSFNIIAKDASGNNMVTMLGYIGEDIPAGVTREITSSVDVNLSKASSIDYTINK